jgi:hypothetical protein
VVLVAFATVHDPALSGWGPWPAPYLLGQREEEMAKTPEAPETAESPTSATMPALSAEQLTEFIALLETVGSVELKLTVPEVQRRSAIEALGMDPLDAQIRQILFFDTPDLRLNAAGVVVRARRIQGRDGDAVVKLRPVVPDRLDPKLRASREFGVEVDAMPGGFVCSGTLKTSVDDALVKQVAAGQAPLRKLFSKAQRRFYADHAPAGLELDDLALLGPINVLKLKFSPRGYARKLVAELWNYPDGSRILELSTKCLPAETFQVVAETRAFLGTSGLDLGAHQETKTRAALEFFSAELGEAAADADASKEGQS